MNEEFTQEIDLRELITLILSKWYIISFFVIISLFAGYYYSYYMLTDVYTARASMIILVQNEEQTSEQNFNYSSKIKQTYSVLAKSDLVTDQVIDELNLSLNASSLRSMMSIEAVTDTIIIHLSVTHSNPELAAAIANKTVEIMQEVTLSLEGFDNIEVIDVASVPISPSGPNHILYPVISTLLGSIVGVGLVLMIEFFNKTIKTTDDIEMRLKLRILAIIPDYDNPKV